MISKTNGWTRVPTVAAVLAAIACSTGTGTSDEWGAKGESAASSGCDVTDWSPIGMLSCSFDGVAKLSCTPIDTDKIAVPWYVDVTATSAAQETLALRFERASFGPTSVVYQLTTPNVDASNVCCNTQLPPSPCYYRFSKVIACSYAPYDPVCLYAAATCTPDWRSVGYSSCTFDSNTEAHCQRISPAVAAAADINLDGTRSTNRETVTATMREIDYNPATGIAKFTGTFNGFCNVAYPDPKCSVNLCTVRECSTEATVSTCIKPMMPRPAVCCDKAPTCCYEIPAVP